jgi:thymidine kinase
MLDVICGPMFSGKTEELIRRLRLADEQGLTTRAFKPAVDQRDPSNLLISHRGSRYPADVVANSTDLISGAQGRNLIGVDEAQFLSPGFVEAIAHLKRAGVYVIVSGLDLDYRAVPFGPMPDLKSVADNVLCLTARCARCGREATLTQRLRDGHPASASEPIIQLGGVDLYEPRCERCYVSGLPVHVSPSDETRMVARRGFRRREPGRKAPSGRRRRG